MKEKEVDVKMAEFHVRSSEIDVKQAKVEMEEGYKRLKAKMDIEYEVLKNNYQQALLDLEEARLHLTCAKDSLEVGFE